MILLNIVFIITFVMTGQANAAPKRRYQASNRRSMRGGEVYGAADAQISTQTGDNNFNLQHFDELPLYESRGEFSQKEAQENTLAEYDSGIKFIRSTNNENNLSPAAIFGYGNQNTLAQATQGGELGKAEINQSSRLRDILDAETQTESSVLFSKKGDTQTLKREASTLLQKNEQSAFRYETPHNRGNLRPPYSGNNIKKKYGPGLQSRAHLTPPHGCRENITPSYLRQPYYPHNTPANNFERIEPIHNQYGRTVNEEAYDQKPVQENELQGGPLQLPTAGTYKIISIEDAINHGLPYVPIKVAVVDTALLDINILGMPHQQDNKNQQKLQNEPLSLTSTDQSNEIKSDSATHANAAVEPNSRTQDINPQGYTLDAYGGEDAAADDTTEVKPDNKIPGETEAQANEVVETNNDNDYSADTQSEEIVQPNGKTQISSSEEDDVALKSRFGSHSNKPSQHFALVEPASKYAGKGLYYDSTGNLIYDSFGTSRVHRHPYRWHQG